MRIHILICHECGHWIEHHLGLTVCPPSAAIYLDPGRSRILGSHHVSRCRANAPHIPRTLALCWRYLVMFKARLQPTETLGRVLITAPHSERRRDRTKFGSSRHSAGGITGPPAQTGLEAVRMANGLRRHWVSYLLHRERSESSLLPPASTHELQVSLITSFDQDFH
jgi:hypothetical protein